MEFKNRSSRRKPMFDDIPSARWLDDSVWEKTRRRATDTVSTPTKSSLSSQKARGLSLPGDFVRRFFLRLKLGKSKQFLKEYIQRIVAFIKGIPSAPSKGVYIRENSRLALAVIICLLAVFVVPFTILKINDGSDASVAGTSTKTSTDATAPTNEPLFDIVKPAGRDLKKEEVFFDPQRKFAKFTDDVNGIPTIVSQQPIPEIYKTNPADGAAKIAKDFGAAELISIDGQQVYFGQDEKGPMTMIFAKNGNLVFVSTTKAVDKEALKVYVGNFE